MVRFWSCLIVSYPLLIVTRTLQKEMLENLCQGSLIVLYFFFCLFLFFHFFMRLVGYLKGSFQPKGLPQVPQRRFSSRDILFLFIIFLDTWTCSRRFLIPKLALGASWRFSLKFLFIYLFSFIFNFFFIIYFSSSLWVLCYFYFFLFLLIRGSMASDFWDFKSHSTPYLLNCYTPHLI